MSSPTQPIGVIAKLLDLSERRVQQLIRTDKERTDHRQGVNLHWQWRRQERFQRHDNDPLRLCLGASRGSSNE